METVIDIRIALEQLGTGWHFGGSVTDGTQAAWDAATWEDERPQPSWAELCAAHTTGTTAAQFASLRAERGVRLASTDKMLLPDYPISADSLAEVKAYRAALRDLPDQTGAPWPDGDIPWPIKPNV